LSAFQPRLEILPPPQRKLWDELCGRVPAGFVLFGGTAIALRLGHRTSVDFDFFANEPFQPGDLLRGLSWLGEAEPTQSSPNTLTILLQREGPVKISFFGGLEFGRVGEPEAAGPGGILVASLLDLAATKLKVIQERAEAKDYRDVAALLQHGLKLPEILASARALYGGTWNAMISLKALNYFADGDLPSLPNDLKDLLSKEAASVSEIPALRRVSDRIAP